MLSRLRISSFLMRATHIMAALYNLAFVYSPLHDWAHGLWVVQWVTMPLLMVTGWVLYRRRVVSHRRYRDHCKDPVCTSAEDESLKPIA